VKRTGAEKGGSAPARLLYIKEKKWRLYGEQLMKVKKDDLELDSKK